MDEAVKVLSGVAASLGESVTRNCIFDCPPPHQVMM